MPGLFRSPPDRTRHPQLIDVFDHGPSFGRGVILAKEATADVCALLRTYIDRLPEAILTSTVYDGFWMWCVVPSIQRQKNRTEGWDRAESFCAFITAIGVYDPNDFDIETPQVDVARILLQMLPAANLSLFAYLCAFFTQIPLSPQNQLEFEDIARFFAVPLLGKDRKNGAKKEEARIMLVWILRRWSRISMGLFEPPDDSMLDMDEFASGLFNNGAEGYHSSSSSDPSLSSTSNSSPQSFAHVPTSGSSSDSVSVYSLPSIYTAGSGIFFDQGSEFMDKGKCTAGADDGDGREPADSMTEWRRAMEADIEQLKRQLKDLTLRLPGTFIN